MSEIRVLFASLPTMLGDILREAVASQPDLRITDERPTLDDLDEVVARAEPHVLVVGSAKAALPSACLRVMFDRPHPNTLTVSMDGRLTSAYRLRPEGVLQENISADGMIAAIRELSRPTPELLD